MFLYTIGGVLDVQPKVGGSPSRQHDRGPNELQILLALARSPGGLTAPLIGRDKLNSC